jgi:hypothetical protein
MLRCAGKLWEGELLPREWRAVPGRGAGFVAWAVGGAEQERVAGKVYGGGVSFVEDRLRGRQSCRKLGSGRRVWGRECSTGSF